MATPQIGKVFAVDEVQVRITRTEPPWLLIHAKLRIDMPRDGLWPPEDVAKFEAWKNGGMPA